MSQSNIPYLKWGQYTSKSERKPDTLLIKVTETDTFDSEYSKNVSVMIDGEEK